MDRLDQARQRYVAPPPGESLGSLGRSAAQAPSSCNGRAIEIDFQADALADRDDSSLARRPRGIHRTASPGRYNIWP